MQHRLLGPSKKLRGERKAAMMLPGLQELLQNIKELEDYLRACRSGEEERVFQITREEMEVVRSFRRFMAQEND